MAKKIVVDNTQVSPNMISGAGKAPNRADVASDMNDSDLISLARTKIGLKVKDIEDDPQRKEGDVVDSEQVEDDSVYADSEYQILLAQADVTLPANASAPDVSGAEGAGFFSGQSANWWMAGTGVVIAGAGVGFALSGSDGDNGATTTNNAPVITSAATANVAENSTAVLTVVATDADQPAQTVTYSITGGVDAAKFAITSGGVLSFVSAPDFESPTDAGANNVYDVQVTANDGNGGTTTQNIAVTVTAVNDNNPQFTSAATANVAENSTAVLTVVATDADQPAQTVTYSITGGADAAKFTITSGGVLSFVSAPDFEIPTDAGGNNVYDVQVTANDGAGGTTMQDIAVTVTPVNDNPVFTSAATANVAENSTAVLTVAATDADQPAQTVTYSITGGADAAKFVITSGGVLSFVSAPNFEIPTDAGGNNVYDVQVTANDGAGGTTMQAIAVTVTDNYENVVVDSTGAYIDLNANGIKDAVDNISADFTPAGNIDLELNPVVIHYNDTPSSPLNLSGFNSDDLIEIDVQAFIDNGHTALNLLAISGIKTLDDFRTAGGNVSYAASSITNASSTLVSNVHTRIGIGSGTIYSNSIRYDGSTGSLSSKIGLRLGDNDSDIRTLLFFSKNATATSPANFTMASGLPKDVLLISMVDFVSLPV